MRSVTTRSTGALVVGLVATAAAIAWLMSRRSDDLGWELAALPRGNVLLVTIDTLRADRVTHAVAPNLTRLSQSGHHYLAAYTHAPLTLPAHASILTGLLPRAHGARGNGAFRLDASHLTLAERLHAHGYRTGAFVGAFVLDARFGLEQGFDRYESVDDERAFAADFSFAERRAPAVLAGAGEWIVGSRDHSRPWLAWVHLFDPHAPYDAPGAVKPGNYDDEVRFVDAELGKFLDGLRQAEALQRTLIIVTADHGEGLGDHGEKTHGLFTYDATMRVPLTITAPGLGAAEHATSVSHIDLVPTVLDVLGLDPDPALPGRSLRLDSGTRPIYLESLEGWLSAGAAPISAVVKDGWKLIESPVPELYHLDQDPGETRNRFGEAAERQRELELALNAMESSPTASTDAPRDPEVEGRLRSLGYASSSPRTRPHRFERADDAKQVLPLYERFLTVLADGGRDVGALGGILRERPRFDAARMVAASVLIESGRAPEAVTLLEAAATLPGSAVAMRERLGAAYLASGRFDRAAALFKEVVAEPTASADAWNGLGAALAESGQPADARRAFDRAVSLAPGAARIRLNRALAALQTGDRALAVADLTDLTAQQPRFPDAWRLLATLRHEGGDKAGAVDAWRHLLAISPNDLETLFNVAVTLRDLGQLDRARDAARQFAAAAPRSGYDRELAALADLTRR